MRRQSLLQAFDGRSADRHLGVDDRFDREGSVVGAAGERLFPTRQTTVGHPSGRRGVSSCPRGQRPASSSRQGQDLVGGHPDGSPSLEVGDEPLTPARRSRDFPDSYVLAYDVEAHLGVGVQAELLPDTQWTWPLEVIRIRISNRFLTLPNSYRILPATMSGGGPPTTGATECAGVHSCRSDAGSRPV